MLIGKVNLPQLKVLWLPKVEFPIVTQMLAFRVVLRVSQRKVDGINIV